ncbi:MAG TPA: hypothetical protein QGI71_03225 [Dehalococcoidia bacterium]|jgi:hypothetical protein|nr:hypothetical protein [Dehalococcoidia bacterium]
MNEPRQPDAPAASERRRGRSRLVSVAVVLTVALVALFARPAALPAQESVATSAPVPPPGGLAMVISGTDDIAALVAAQQFQMAAVWKLDVST